MSVIVEGMDMPVNCFRCSLDSGVWKPEQGQFILCRYTKGRVDYDDVPTDRRLPCCGLKELPEKHGDLVDTNEKVNISYFDDMNQEWSWRAGTVADALAVCEEFPETIVEEEE